MRVFVPTLIVALVGCRSNVPDPLPESISPARGYNGDDTVVTITGRYFFPEVGIDASGGDPDVNSAFRAWLQVDGGVAHPLAGVSLADFATLDAVVPSGLGEGLYDLHIAGPTGAEGVLPDAFEVTSTEADHLRIRTVDDNVSYEVGQQAVLHLQLEDRDNQPVNLDEAFEVVVTAANSDGGALDATFSAGTLDDGGLLPTGGVQGGLGPDGAATITLSVGSVTTVLVSLAPENTRSGVVGDELLLQWEAGAATALLIRPSKDIVFAGETFGVELTPVNDLGQAVEDVTKDVVLREEDNDDCGSFASFVRVTGTTTVDVTLETATGHGGCPTTRLVALGGLSGQSEPITVHPGPLHHYDVTTTASSVVAGDIVVANVVPVDAYSNEVRLTDGVITVSDTIGSLDPADFQCFGDGPWACLPVPTKAATGIRITADGFSDAGDPIHGESDPYDVLAAEPERLVVSVVGPVTAGAVADVAVEAQDEYGNRVDAAEWDPSIVTFTDDAGEVTCAWLGTDVDGIERYDCTLFTATASDEIVADAGALGLTGTSDPFAVINGPLARVAVGAGDTDVIAGTSVPMSFEAFDAFDNPYVVQGDATLQIGDSSGTLDVTTVTLGADGKATTNAAFQSAGTTVVTASQDGIVLGASPPILVHPGTSAGLTVALTEPWVFTGAPADVVVTAVDAFGNQTSLTASATVRSASAAFADTVVPLVAGQGTGAVTFTGPRSNDTITATAGALSGTSDRVVAVTDCGVGGPVPSVLFAGVTDAIVCRNPQGVATIAGSFTGSSGSPTLFGLALDDGAAAPVFSDSVPTVVVTSRARGAFGIRALVATAAGCGADVAATAFIGDDDGTPTGPISLGPDVTSAALNSSVKWTLLGASDCAGDPASAPIFVRSDRGVITDATVTGAGLVVLPNVDGDAQFTLSTAAATGGTATVRVGSASGAGLGVATVDITGDDQRPIVWSQTPSGDTTGMVSEVVLRFSEDLLDTSVTPSTFTIGGPSPVSVLDAVPTGDTVRLVLDVPIDSGSGLWTITAVSSTGPAVRDVAGNKLDGAYNGTVSSYVGTFGDVPSTAPSVTGCAADTATVHPDGDDGPGVEADFVHLALSAAAQPEWWVISVQDGAGGLVRRDYVSATAAEETWTWDARDATGRVVDPGSWELVVEGDDGQGNRGAACLASVTVTGGP